MPEKKAVKRPQDHRPKKEEHLYTFTVDGSTYTLPPAETAVEHMPGRLLRDAYMDGEEGQMRLGFAMLEHVYADPAALEALYSLPAPRMLEHIQKWMEVRAEQGSATVGESSSSSA